MILAVDTSVLIDVENRKESVIAALSKLSAENPLPAKITFITYFEFLHGLAERHPAKKEKAMAFMEMFDMMQPTKKTAEILSHLRRKYERKGQSLPLADLMIASQCIENNCLLVTADRGFERLEELSKVVIK